MSKIDPVDQWLIELDSARQLDEEKAIVAQFQPEKPAAPEKGLIEKGYEFNADVERWTKRLPRNISIGVVDAALNTWDAFKRAALAAGEGAEMREAMDEGRLLPEKTPAQRRIEGPSVDKALEDGEVVSAVRSFREHLTQNDSTADKVTQGAAQFVIPFMGWTKALGGLNAASKATNVGRAVAAEAATVSTSFGPHDPRLADLYALGQHTEGALGDALNTAAPDGSLINAYIDYMTDRENEGDAEGRFKNVVDSLVGSAAIAGVFKTGAKSLRVARAMPEYLRNIVPKTQVTDAIDNVALPAGVGDDLIVYHGTRHDFDAFDSSKIGTGEGAQSYGYGLYFAENNGVAKSYRAAGGDDGYPKVSVASVEPEYMDRYANELTPDAMDVPRKGLKGADAKRVALQWVKTPEVRARLEALPDEAFEVSYPRIPEGNILEVDIPDEKVARMLDHDADMSAQEQIIGKIPEEDQARLQELLDEYDQPELSDLSGKQFYQVIKRAISEDYLPVNPIDGNFDNAAKLASEYLSEKGIPGIRYLDRSSRNKGEGTRNIVLFSDKDAKILKKNDKPVAEPITDATGLEAAMLDLQDIADTAAMTPKQKAAYEGLREYVQRQSKAGENVRASFAAATRGAANYLELGAAQTPQFKKLVDDLLPKASKTEEVAQIAPTRIIEAPKGHVAIGQEGHTVVVGDAPLVTFLKKQDAEAAVRDLQRTFGYGFEERFAAQRAKLTDKNFDTLHTFSRVLQQNKDRPVSTHSLVTALEKNLNGDTKVGAFYKELLGRIAKKNLGGETTVSSKPGRSEHSAGFFKREDSSIELYDRAFRNPETLVHTFAHEAVHAATVRELAESPETYRKLADLFHDVVDARLAAESAPEEVIGNGWTQFSNSTPGGAKPYGMTNPLEFVAEIEANPKFRDEMKKIKIGEKTAWEKYREVIGKILGLSAVMIASSEFEKLLNPKQEEPRA